jgi:hypothetical protein
VDEGGDSVPAYLTPQTISTSTAVSLQSPVTIEHKTYSFLLTRIDDLLLSPAAPTTSVRCEDKATSSDSDSPYFERNGTSTARYRVEAVSE